MFARAAGNVSFCGGMKAQAVDDVAQEERKMSSPVRTSKRELFH
jgi:hypothetical protein